MKLIINMQKVLLLDENQINDLNTYLDSGWKITHAFSQAISTASSYSTVRGKLVFVLEKKEQEQPINNIFNKEHE